MLYLIFRNKICNSLSYYSSYILINSYKFSTHSNNNDCKLTIVQRLATLELKKHLISRFGSRQLESKILNSDHGIKFLSTIAYFYSYSKYYSDGIPITKFPITEIPNLDSIKSQNEEISWLIDRITQPISQDNVPKPHYPSLFLNHTMQWPFKPSELDDFREITSMYKFPFYKPTVDNIPIKSERFNPDTYNQSVDNLRNKEIETIDNTCGDYELPNYYSGSNNQNMSSDNYIYSPSELEVIQSDHLLHFDKTRSKR